MLNLLIIQPGDSEPIYQQLENQLLRFIQAGRLKPGDELPSVRVMASHLAVNAMTVSKAINRLVEQGWLEYRRGRPTRVADQLPNALDIIDKQLHQDIRKLIAHCQQLRIEQNALKSLIDKLWSEER